MLLILAGHCMVGKGKKLMKKQIAGCLLALTLAMPAYAEPETNTESEPVAAQQLQEEGLADAEESSGLEHIEPILDTPEALAAEAAEADTLPQDLSPWGMYQSADRVVKAVMILLLLASLLTWAVWAFKAVQLRLVRAQTRAALQRLVAAKSLTDANAESACFK